MKIASILIPLWFTLFSVYSNFVLLSSAQAPQVIDFDGRPVSGNADFIINRYKIVKVPRLDNIAVTIASPSPPTDCPLQVILFPANSTSLEPLITSVPLSFHPQNTSETVVHESSLIRIKTTFRFTTPCPDDTAEWRTNSNDGSSEANFLVLDGCDRDPGCDSAFDWFKVEPVEGYSNVYKLVSSPQVSPFKDSDVTWETEEGSNLYRLSANVEDDPTKEAPLIQFVREVYLSREVQ